MSDIGHDADYAPAFHPVWITFPIASSPGQRLRASVWLTTATRSLDARCPVNTLPAFKRMPAASRYPWAIALILANICGHRYRRAPLTLLLRWMWIKPRVQADSLGIHGDLLQPFCNV